MKAVVLTDEAEIRLAERPVPVAGPGAVLLRVNACGICGTDLHAPLMSGMFTSNVVLGHEFAGTVVDTGEGVGDLGAGDEVVVNPIAMACGTCEACRRGFSNQCLTALTQTSGVAQDGGMAEFVAVERRRLHPVPEGVDVRDAAWTEPLGVAVRAVGQGSVHAGASIAILGAGAIGQLILQVALSAGAGESLVVEPSGYRREVAKNCGASTVVSPDQVTDVDRLYDVVFDCTGASAALGTALALVEHGGRVVVVGSYTSPITFEARAASAREASIVFTAVYRDHLEFATALRLLERGVIDLGPLTTSILPITRHEEAFASLRNPEQAVKILLDPSIP